MTPPLRPGLLILHGNRLEHLAEAVFSWLGRNPLGALEEEIFLVQSNGMAEWLKMEIAAAQGVCAATRVELPARFIWRAYRAVLGRAAVPPTSALDKLPLTWRLMGLLPELAHEPGFEPVAGFLGNGDSARRLQLAQRLADLFDQYQVYRADWLDDWGRGVDELRCAAAPEAGPPAPVPAEQRWQPALWRAVLAGLVPNQQAATRPMLQQRFLAALRAGATVAPPANLPHRIVLFGTTHIPQQTLQALAALSPHSQVLMAVPNPCRYHWADIIDGRELLRAAQRRQPLRAGRDLAALPLQDMHAHGHPLLAAWGRQGRDFVRQLDAFDDVPLARQHFEVPRVDLFDDGPGGTLLQQVQALIRDLVPLAEHPKTVVASGDRSIVFHVAHSAQREVEILHDQLLQLLAHPPGGGPLQPRDVVVMVPDIDAFAPAIRSVFGQHARGQARHIPWGIADLSDRAHQPLLVALEWLLRAPLQRFAFSEVRDLLDVPATARRFALDAEDLPTLVAWIEGAGIRWGLHAAQRSSLDLPECGEANTWSFGLRRMLLGYATGDLAGGLDERLEHADGGGFAGVEPYAEVAGLSAGLAGNLADLVAALDGWWRDASASRSPAQWGDRLRRLVQDFFVATDDADRAMLAAADDALSAWLQACEDADFAAPLDLGVVREAWLAAVDAPGAARRFKAGGVTFCTLLPLRAIPFQVVCLLGMNDEDYPRRSPRSDFDLMALPGQARPGDRSRRDDDRQLMLDALLSARRVLYVSWAGRSQRDNQEQAPSMLVAQLRDYLAAGWGPEVVRERTLEHPLQPFSRRYFEPGPADEPGGGLFTYASEWRVAHADSPAAAHPPGAPAETEPAPEKAAAVLTVSGLARFLRNPVKEFFRQRLQVVFDEFDSAAIDDEAFASVGLERWSQLDELVRQTRMRIEAVGRVRLLRPEALAALVETQVVHLRRAGRLPLAGPGRRVATELVQTLVPMLAQWLALQAQHPRACDKRPLRWVHPSEPDLRLEDWLVGLRSTGDAAAPEVWIDLQAGKLADKSGKTARADKLLEAWVRCLASAACGCPADGIVVGADVWVQATPPPREAALATLQAMMQAWREGLQGYRPLPTAVLTGLVFLSDPAKARPAYEGSDFGGPGEGREACLARLYPDYSSLAGQGDFEPSSRRLYEPYRDWLARHVTVQALPNAAQAAAAGDE